MQPDQCVTVARNEVERAERDIALAKEALGRIDDGGQVTANLLGLLRDARASLNTSYHAVAVREVDPKLRDLDLADEHGAVFRYRGTDVGVLNVAGVESKCRHVLRVVELAADGFLAERDHGTAERFTYKPKEA